MRLIYSIVLAIGYILGGATPVPSIAAQTMELRSLPMTFEVKGELIFATGTFNGTTDQTFWKAIGNTWLPGKTIVFDSNGGNTGGAIKLGNIIRKYKMNTMVSPKNYCVSMCPFVFLAGVKRIAPVGALIGVHQVYLPTKGESDSTITGAEMHTILSDFVAIEQYARAMGATSELAEFALSTPPWGMRYLTQAEMRQVRLLN